jgi:hypothetical protein
MVIRGGSLGHTQHTLLKLAGSTALQSRVCGNAAGSWPGQ